MLRVFVVWVSCLLASAAVAGAVGHYLSHQVGVIAGLATGALCLFMLRHHLIDDGDHRRRT